MKYFLNDPAVLSSEMTDTREQKWMAFCSALEESNVSAPDSSKLISDLKTAFLFSDFIFNTLTRKPELYKELQQTDSLYQKYSPATYADTLRDLLQDMTEEKQLAETTSRFRCREMIRIAFRDLTGQADLPETMADLSALADACIHQVFSLRFQALIRQHGSPRNHSGIDQNIVVLGLGKLGACELNFSSDVDLILAFPEEGRTSGGARSITNQEFFSLLAQSFLRVFKGTSNFGMIFRVDLRLRPFGENGPLVMSFAAMENYFESQGREWERYALIKARVVAGDRAAGSRLLRMLNPFIYRRYLDYNTFDSLREMKQSIHREVQRRGFKGNIKLGSGGIREIEFFGQVFQLIRGGVESPLQEPSILRVLKLLKDDGHITNTIYRELTDAYCFLRTTEHRLQEFDDRQTHVLPKDETKRQLLALSLGIADTTRFQQQITRHMEAVHFHFSQILSTAANEAKPQSEADQKTGFDVIWHDAMDMPDIETVLLAAGFQNPSEIVHQIESLQNEAATRSLSQVGRKRLDQLMPRVIETCGAASNADLAFCRIVELIKTIEQRTSYLSLLIEYPSALQQLVTISTTSPWIIKFLTRHPVLLDELLDTRILYSPPDKEQLVAELEKKLAHVPPGDLEQQIEQLCVFKQINTLRVAAADISANYPLMRVSDHLSDIAELILARIFQLSFNHLIEKYGTPECNPDIDGCREGFAVIAYGKLGGIELGYGSDLDMVFLHGASSEQTSGGSASTVDGNQFYARLGQRIIHTLTTHTRAGKLYEIDMRLRPSGNSGPLVSHLDSFQEYQEKNAWTWEHQALVRARAICGDPAICRCFESIRRQILTKKRSIPDLRIEIQEMREKIRTTHTKTTSHAFHLKQGRGGIVDIEFIVQYLVLAHSFQYPELVRWSDNVRQLEALAQTGILESQTAMFLKEAYLTFRANVHRLNLQELAPVTDLEEILATARGVVKIWKDCFSP